MAYHNWFPTVSQSECSLPWHTNSLQPSSRLLFFTTSVQIFSVLRQTTFQHEFPFLKPITAFLKAQHKHHHDSPALQGHPTCSLIQSLFMAITDYYLLLFVKNAFPLSYIVRFLRTTIVSNQQIRIHHSTRHNILHTANTQIVRNKSINLQAANYHVLVIVFTYFCQYIGLLVSPVRLINTYE